MFLISSSPSAALLNNRTAAAAATTYEIPITASCGIWLVRLPVSAKIPAPASVKASAIPKVVQLSKSRRKRTATQIHSEAIWAIAMSMKIMPR